MTTSSVVSRYFDLARSWLRYDGSVLFYGAPDRDFLDALIHDVEDRRVLRCRAGDTDPDRRLRGLRSLFATVGEAELMTLSVAHRRVLVDRVLSGAPAASDEPPVGRLGPAVLDLLRCLSATTPLLLVVDAMHRLDGPTRDVLRFVAETLEEPRVQMLAAEEAHPASIPEGFPLCPPPVVMIPLPAMGSAR